MLVGYNNQDIIEIPPGVTEILISSEYLLVIGTQQDSSTNRLVAYRKRLRDNLIVNIHIFEKTLKMKTEPILYYLYTNRYSYNISSEIGGSRESIIKFIDGEIPFYVWTESIYNRKHEIVCPITDELINYLMKSEIYKINQESCLFWQPGTLLTLYFDEQMITFQAATLKTPQPGMLVANAMTNTFKVDDKIINELKALSTFEEAIKYLGSQLTFDVIVKERQNNGEKIRVMRS